MAENIPVVIGREMYVLAQGRTPLCCVPRDPVAIGVQGRYVASDFRQVAIFCRRTAPTVATDFLQRGLEISGVIRFAGQLHRNQFADIANERRWKPLEKPRTTGITHQLGRD